MAEDGVYQATVSGMVVMYIGLLRKGPHWTEEVTPEVEQLRAAHVANNRHLQATGKFAAVGPVIDGSDLLGHCIIRANSLTEARAITDIDPAVQAGRFVYEIHPWMVNEGTFDVSTTPQE
ncbi:MAG TPA: YciI family protein [Ktedonobacterales bacterium]|nr:YciI family protein [Ktedonobacterales bacterium]